MMSEEIMKKKMRGFTLIELMIVIAIVGILAAIAYPSYQESVKKSRRSDAQGVLTGLAGAMERHYTNTNSYEDAAVGPADIGTPIIYAIKSPLDGAAIYYNLTIEAADSSSYILRATDVNAQDGDGYLELSSTGAKSWDRDDSGGIGAGEACWAKSCGG